MRAHPKSAESERTQNLLIFALKIMQFPRLLMYEIYFFLEFLRIYNLFVDFWNDSHKVTKKWRQDNFWKWTQNWAVLKIYFLSAERERKQFLWAH